MYSILLSCNCSNIVLYVELELVHHETCFLGACLTVWLPAMAHRNIGNHVASASQVVGSSKMTVLVAKLPLQAA